MSIDTQQLREYIIEPTLKHLELWSEEAEDLLLGTAAQESHMGTYIKQVGGGPALGIFQMEPATHNDIWTNYLKYKRSLGLRIDDEYVTCNSVSYDEDDYNTEVDPQLLIGNLPYAAAMARVHYLRVPKALPKKSELEYKDYVQALAEYWKEFYNTPLGKGTTEEFVANWYLRVV